MANAQAPGKTTFVGAIDPSPGPDAGAGLLAINHAIHRLYVAGGNVKVIDTTSLEAITGIDIGTYPDDQLAHIQAVAVDESAAPAGNKLYLLLQTIARTGDSHSYLRIVDCATNTNVTTPGSDIALPVDTFGFRTMTVNSRNHKVYVGTWLSGVAVVDTQARTVIKTIPEAGYFVFADPATNKVLALNNGPFNHGGFLIHSSDDSVTQLPQDFYPRERR
jgi:hypothetical protein